MDATESKQATMTAAEKAFRRLCFRIHLRASEERYHDAQYSGDEQAAAYAYGSICMWKDRIKKLD